MDYDSDREDLPCRMVLKTQGNFRLLNPQPPLTAKLDKMKAIASRYFNKGWVPVIRPVPSPSDVRHACRAMDKGHNGIWTGSVFHPPSANSDPYDVFPLRRVNGVSSSRFIDRFCIRRRHVPHVSPLKTMAVFTDGSCYHQWKPRAMGGCAFVINRNGSLAPCSTPGTFRFPLESVGPDGWEIPATANRAEIRAVVGFLEFRPWMGEGWERIVVVTDSTYVANCATRLMPLWAGRAWLMAAGKPVANRDLLERLSTALGEYARAGCEVSFWVVPRRFNGLADAAAKAAAQEEMARRPGVLI
ncbi:ribonuclease H-like domain-containing protein [Chaetomium strumarium]|uniref:ribonuclease H n=1 Tax=Chaetomium strumarium TaxID=1170767 RepID=A0AAJ0GUA9_9PEZI|nr:ribonuclease H-like domain-containing protein [Chaetomium strumarium]